MVFPEEQTLNARTLTTPFARLRVSTYAKARTTTIMTASTIKRVDGWSVAADSNIGSQCRESVVGRVRKPQLPAHIRGQHHVDSRLTTGWQQLDINLTSV